MYTVIVVLYTLWIESISFTIYEINIFTNQNNDNIITISNEEQFNIYNTLTVHPLTRGTQQSEKNGLN